METEKKEFIVFAHLKQYSVLVKEGQWVEQGDTLGLCGNSGNSTEPHLHFQIQNLPSLSAAQGAWVYFKDIIVNGKTKKNALPVKGNKVSNR